MAFDSWAAFWAMGHHGPYVWSAYGLTAIIVIWNILQPGWRHRRWLKAQAQLQRRKIIKG
ncbi:MAG: heme exporter protein CcmD [Pseudomonadales bacterium]|nr:heme exporter protein CcmD [Pseudomonadales bacterium]